MSATYVVLLIVMTLFNGDVKPLKPMLFSNMDECVFQAEQYDRLMSPTQKRGSNIKCFQTSIKVPKESSS